MISISFVVPVYSGEKYLRDLANEVIALKQLFEETHAPLQVKELILVDDSAIDASPEIVDDLAQSNSWIKALHMSTNFGQHAATIAGVIQSTGNWVVTIDEDLQHPPKAILEMLRRVALTRCDIVYARSLGGDVHQSIFRDLSSRLYKRVIVWLTGNSTIRKANSFRLIRGPIARAASLACGHDTYFDVALLWFTKRIETMKMPLKDHRYIESKSSGYNLRSLLAHARRMLVSSQIKVLRLGSLAGLLTLVASICVGLVLLTMKILDPGAIAVRGWVSIMLAITFFGGASIFLIGILLEYMSFLVLRAHGRPLFFMIDRSGDDELVQWAANIAEG